MYAYIGLYICMNCLPLKILLTNINMHIGTSYTYVCYNIHHHKYCIYKYTSQVFNYIFIIYYPYVHSSIYNIII